MKTNRFNSPLILSEEVHQTIIYVAPSQGVDMIGPSQMIVNLLD